jgi:hypothetical protein
LQKLNYYYAIVFIFSFLFADSANAIEYDDLFPLYVDACALTQIKQMDQHSGNPWGHSILYVKGLCKDNSIAYPTVKVCDPDVDLRDPRSGTMLSAVRAFDNTNWIATPGKLAFDGGLPRNQVIDEKAYESTKEQVTASKVFKGAQMRSAFRARKPLLFTDDEFMIKSSLGTEYAVSWGRIALCHRIPITSAQLETLAKHLNSLNDSYRTGEIKYKWHTFNNNCAHLVRNSLAAIGIVKPKVTGRSVSHWAKDFLTPIGEFQSLQNRLKKFHVPNVIEAYEDQTIRREILTKGHLRFSHGTMVIKKDTLNNNFLFEPKTKISFLIPFSGKKNRFLKHSLKKNRFSDLLQNLRHFEAEYTKALEDSNDMANRGKFSSKYVDQSFLSFFDLYLNFLQSSIFDVKSKIELIEEN